MKSSALWDTMPCKLLKSNRMQRGARSKKSIVSYMFHAGFLTYCMAMKMEVTYSSETLDNFQWTTWHYIPEDRTLQPSLWFAQHCLTQSQLNALSSHLKITDEAGTPTLQYL
jgi:hypothetical protein